MENSEITLVIADAGPIIHLDELECLDLLTDFQTILVPDAVWAEVSHHRPQALQHEKPLFRKVAVSHCEDNRLRTIISLYTLHKGEQEALVLMRQYSDALLLTDDAAVRLAANSLQFQAYGSIGVILRGLRKQKRNKQQTLDVLASIPQISSLHIKRSLL